MSEVETLTITVELAGTNPQRRVVWTAHDDEHLDDDTLAYTETWSSGVVETITLGATGELTSDTKLPKYHPLSVLVTAQRAERAGEQLARLTAALPALASEVAQRLPGITVPLVAVAQAMELRRGGESS